jgi:hypothetical protein
MQIKCREGIWALLLRVFDFEGDVRRLAADGAPSVLQLPSVINVNHY